MFQKNKDYFIICSYVIGTVTICALIIKAIFSISAVLSLIGTFISMISPFLIGFFIAYLLNPMVVFFEQKFFQKWLHLKQSRWLKLISILLSYIIVFGIIVICLVYIIPQLLDSLLNIQELVTSAQSSYANIIAYIDKFATKHPDMDISGVQEAAKNLPKLVNDIIQNINPKELISQLAPTLISTSLSVISGLANLLISIMVSVYMLLDKNRLQRHATRMIYALFNRETANYISRTITDCNRIFGGFIIGKTIDSFIIGCICLLVMNIIGIPYALLISVIVGITNMIPYFGPFIGAIPGSIILLLINPKAAIIFVIWIIILQQFDGLYLGPKILGESTGLRPLWIIFSITIGGAAAGPLGMFLGVPTFAVFVCLANRFLNHRLAKKQRHDLIDTSAESPTETTEKGTTEKSDTAETSLSNNDSTKNSDER